MLRAAANSHDTPGAVLADVNETLVPEIPPAMFVTCLYAIIDTDGGEVVFANAGHNLPYVRMADGVSELRATGMPLGLMPEMTYEEKTYHLDEGEVMVLTSDGITEAHDPEGEMYGFERLMGRVGGDLSADMCSHLVADLERFTGPDLEQEDDITLVVVQRTSSAEVSAKAFGDGSRNVLTSFSVPSEEGNERIAIDRVSEAVADVEMEIEQFERLKTAVGESVMNAMEHGNRYRADLAVDVEVADTGPSVVVRVTDHGDGPGIPDAVTPDIEAKIAGEQSPRGWGLFLIGQMVDEMRTQSGEGTHTVELVINKKGAVQ
jgi:anti-sigma regulatory factor (Ser/Thr protein kinase)